MHQSTNSAATVIAAILLGLGTSSAVAGVTVQGDFRIEYKGNSIGPYANFDGFVMTYMTQNQIHDAQLTVRKSGKILFSHAYTYGSAYPLVRTTSVFALASISKMFAAAAFTNMLNKRQLTGGEKVYHYLGITAPLLPTQIPDKRSKDIVSLELAEHTAGLPGEGDGDPLFTMRDIEVQLGSTPITPLQFAEYLYGIKLLSTPGTTYLYSNVGYFLLGEVIAQAAGTSYTDYIKSALLDPMGLTNVTRNATLLSDANPNQVPADNPYTGPSVLDITANAPIDPFIFEGGDILWGITAAPTDLVTNAETVSAFVGKWNAFGLGGRVVGNARDGCLPGESTWVESATTDIDFALLFNKQPCLSFSSSVISQINAAVSGL